MTKDFTDIGEKIVEFYKENANDIHAIQMYDEYKLSLLENERYDFPKQDVLIGIIAPAFGCEGGGLQIKLPVSIHSLIALGYIEEKF